MFRWLGVTPGGILEKKERRSRLGGTRHSVKVMLTERALPSGSWGGGWGVNVSWEKKKVPRRGGRIIGVRLRKLLVA